MKNFLATHRDEIIARTRAKVAQRARAQGLANQRSAAVRDALVGTDASPRLAPERLTQASAFGREPIRAVRHSRRLFGETIAFH